MPPTRPTRESAPTRLPGSVWPPRLRSDQPPLDSRADLDLRGPVAIALVRSVAGSTSPTPARSDSSAVRASEGHGCARTTIVAAGGARDGTGDGHRRDGVAFRSRNRARSAPAAGPR